VESIGAAAVRNDELLRHISDFIRSDERTHVRKGGHIIKVSDWWVSEDLPPLSMPDSSPFAQPPLNK
jgi:hypothetical protein